jgi:iron complex outermembrane receptor protein
MNKLYTILSLLSLVINANAQNYKGIVLEKETDIPIIYAEIYFPELHSSTITDENGHFLLNDAPTNTISVTISMIGYKTYSGKVNFNKQQKFYLEQSHISLKDVVISVPNGKLQGENIVNIESKKIKELKESAPVSLAEALSNLPGIDQISTGSGIGKPVIRGLTGNRIVTYTQGIRLENQQWGSEHGLGVGDIGIESVEVIKGPASLLYGADALGGVLYFVDERYTNTNSVNVYAESKYFSNSQGLYNNIGIKLNKNNFSFNLFGAINSNADYSIPGNKKVFNTRFDEKNIKTSIGYSKNNWISNLRYSYLKNNFGITEKDSTYTGKSDRNLELPFQTIDNHNFSFENILFANESKFNLSLGYTINNRKEFEEEQNHPSLNMILQTGSYNLKWNSPKYIDKLSIIVGSQGMYQTNKNEGEEVLIPDATTKDFGMFSMINYDLDKLNLQGGLRLDSRNIYSAEQEFHGSHDEDHNHEHDTHFPELNKTYIGYNYSFGASYKFDNDITIRTNLSSGFRAPNTTELLSDGIHHGSGQYIKGNQNLISENANQLDLELDYSDNHLIFSINPFINKINNYIYLNPTGEIEDNAPVYKYNQIDAILYGGEIGFHYHPHNIHWLHINSNLSTVFAQDNNDNPLPLIPATRINTTFKAQFYSDGLFRINNVFIQNTTKLKQDRTSLFETETSAYSLINIGTEFELNNKKLPIEFQAGVKNIFNTEYIDHLSRLKSLGINNQGINIYIGLKINFKNSI